MTDSPGPTFASKGAGRFVFAWPQYHLQATVSRIHQNHERTGCHLVFTSSHPDANPHIFQTRFNLEAGRSRTELAKDMAIRYKVQLPEPIDWKNLLEYLSTKTLKEFEKGEPVLQLTSEDPVGSLEYLVAPIAPVGKPTALFGNPGSGKSKLCVILSIVCILPWEDNGLRLTAPKEPTPTLFLDYEADPDDIRRDLWGFSRGMELGLLPLHYRRCTLPLADDLEAIRNHVEAIGAKAVIIDSTSLAAGGDLNHMETATEYIRALRQLGITSISLAHTNKDPEKVTATVLGSVLFEAGFRSIWEVKGHGDDDGLDIALFHRKSNLSQKSRPLGYRITFGQEGNTISWQDPKNIDEFVERMSVNTRILESLKRGRLSTAQLVEMLGVRRNTCDQSLRRLQQANRITGNADGWGLLQREEGT